MQYDSYKLYRIVPGSLKQEYDPFFDYNNDILSWRLFHVTMIY
jgi:hypothetical protein